MAVEQAPDENADLGWNVLNHGSLNSQIRDEIMRVVQHGRLMPGDRLPSERELAGTLQVSRPSVREAVRSLQAEGRLVVRHGRGVFVAEPATRRRLLESMAKLDHNLAELFTMREILEVPAARFAAQNQDENALQAVKEAFELLDEALTRNPLDFDELQRLDATFHFRIVQAAGNRLLEQTQDVINELLRIGMQTTLAVPGRIEQSRVEHERLLTSVLNGDPTAAARTARLHVQGARRAATKRLAAVTGETPKT